MGSFIDMTGNKFGMLTVIEKASKNKCGEYKWLCKCDCGKSNVICLGSSLRSGIKTSCGCNTNKKAINKPKRTNKYKVVGDICIVYSSNGGEFIIDSNQINILDKYLWFIDKAYGYVCTHCKINDVITTVRLHRLITNCPDDMVVDHINHNILDNRLCNLRVCTNMENLQNRGAQVNNKSTGVKGVWPNGKRYMSRIKTKDGLIYLGTFDTIKEASDAYDTAATKYFGDFACLNNYQETK